MIQTCRSNRAPPLKPAPHLDRLSQNVRVIVPLDLLQLLHYALHSRVALVPLAAHRTLQTGGGGGGGGRVGFTAELRRMLSAAPR